MLPRIMCWIFGHGWKQCGKRTVQHREKNAAGDLISQVHRSHLMFHCNKCGALKEYTCKVAYESMKDITDD